MAQLNMKDGETMFKKTIQIIFIVLMLTACNNGDVVDKHGDVENLERLEEFITNMNNNKEDEITITTYTEEGDPIHYILTFNGNSLNVEYDGTKDKYGSKERFTTTCREITKNKYNNGYEYYLEGCTEKGNIYIFATFD